MIGLTSENRFPKTYPAIAYPIFTIQKPIRGLQANDITKLSNAIHAEAQKQKGSEMVFQIVTFAQDWIASNVKPPVEVVGSLATEMNRRAQEKEMVGASTCCSVVNRGLRRYFRRRSKRKKRKLSRRKNGSTNSRRSTRRRLVRTASGLSASGSSKRRRSGNSRPASVRAQTRRRSRPMTLPRQSRLLKKSSGRVCGSRRSNCSTPNRVRKPPTARDAGTLTHDVGYRVLGYRVPGGPRVHGRCSAEDAAARAALHHISCAILLYLPRCVR